MTAYARSRTEASLSHTRSMFPTLRCGASLFLSILTLALRRKSYIPRQTLQTIREKDKFLSLVSSVKNHPNCCIAHDGHGREGPDPTTIWQEVMKRGKSWYEDAFFFTRTYLHTFRL